MFNRLVVIGAGGHGKVVADVAMKIGYTDIAFLDDRAEGYVMGYPIIGEIADCQKLNDGKTDFVVAVGDNLARKTIAEKYSINWTTLVHPSAQIGSNVTVGKGTVITANAVVNACATVGKHSIINTSSVVEHDDVIGDFVHISPKAVLGGGVHVGECTHIGLGAAVKNNINICGNSVIGAGAAVVKEIDAPGIYAGVPAEKIKKNEDS